MQFCAVSIYWRHQKISFSRPRKFILTLFWACFSMNLATDIFHARQTFLTPSSALSLCAPPTFQTQLSLNSHPSFQMKNEKAYRTMNEKRKVRTKMERQKNVFLIYFIHINLSLKCFHFYNFFFAICFSLSLNVVIINFHIKLIRLCTFP